ncbi:MAG TPA: carboxymuconolactone decarboxylase family protein [Methanomassiliicoccales archaeon]
MSLDLISKQQPDVIAALYRLKGTVFKDGALSVKEKELIAVAVTALLKCDECLLVHANKAKEAGATKDEIRESLLVAMYLAGPSTVIWTDKIDEIIK